MLAFGCQNILLAGMIGISYLGQEMKKFPFEQGESPQLVSTLQLGTCMGLICCSKCTHTAWTASRGTAACWITPMASPVVSAGSKTVANLLTHSADLKKKKNCFSSEQCLPQLLNCSRLLGLVLRGSRRAWPEAGVGGDREQGTVALKKSELFL